MAERRALNPWFSMWTQPRATMRQVLEGDPERFVIALAAIGGAAEGVDRASLEPMGYQYPSLAHVALTVAWGALSGLVFLYVFGFLLRWTGGWFQGRGSASGIRAAIAWSHVISIWGLLLWIPGLALFGKELFTTETPRVDADPTMAGLLAAFSVLQLAVWAWSVVVLVRSLAEVQRFSVGEALVSAVLAALPLFAVAALAGGVLAF